MKILLLGAKTGQGHHSVLNAIEKQLKNIEIEVESHPSFYEDIFESNQILSDFYNIVQIRSMELGVVLNEIMVTEGTKQRDHMYHLWKPNMEKILSQPYDAIISTTPLINYSLIKFFNGQNTKYIPKIYIVVTDPYKPMYPGFDIQGANRYFCPTEISKEQLVKNGISDKQINVFGYPLDEKYFSCENNKKAIKSKYEINSNIALLINCGAGGSLLFKSISENIIKNQPPNCHVIIACGNNKLLYSLLQKFANDSSYNNLTVLSYVDNMQELYTIADLCIMKPGANSVFEALKCKAFPLIVGFEGLFYQERGVYEYLEDIFGFELKVNNMNNLIEFINVKMNAAFIDHVQSIMKMMNFNNAALQIAQTIERDFNNNYA